MAQGKIVGIFPEGTFQERSKGSTHAKTGAARLALWNKVPIIPVGIHHHVGIRGGVRALVERRNVVKNFFYHPRSYELHFGEPFTLSSYYDKPITRELLYDATDYIMNRINPLTHIEITAP